MVADKSPSPAPALQAVGTSPSAGMVQGLACGAPACVSGCVQARAPVSPPPLQHRPLTTPAPRPALGRPRLRPPLWRSGRSRRPSPPSSGPGRAASASHSPSADPMKAVPLPCSHAASSVYCSKTHKWFSMRLAQELLETSITSLGAWHAVIMHQQLPGYDCQRLTSSLSLLRLRSRMTCTTDCNSAVGERQQQPLIEKPLQQSIHLQCSRHLQLV